MATRDGMENNAESNPASSHYDQKALLQRLLCFADRNSPPECQAFPAIADLTAEITHIEEGLDSGGFADIHRGSWRHGQEIHDVAVKVLRVRKREDSDGGVRLSKRLSREIRAWHRLNHPNIVKLLGISYNVSGRPALIMYWHRNGNAAKYLATRKDSTTLKIALVTDVARGLAYLHTLSPLVVHGDIKANNVLITEDEHAALSDFGLSQLIEDTVRPTGLTTTTAAGAIRWQAPEVMSGELEDDDIARLTTASDVWSFACTAYELLTGMIPYYQYRSTGPIVKAVSEGVKPRWEEEDGSALCEASDMLRNLLNRCWSFAAPQRPSMSEVASQMEGQTSLRSLVLPPPYAPAPHPTSVPLRKQQPLVSRLPPNTPQPLPLTSSTSVQYSQPGCGSRALTRSVSCPFLKTLSSEVEKRRYLPDTTLAPAVTKATPTKLAREWHFVEQNEGDIKDGKAPLIPPDSPPLDRQKSTSGSNYDHNGRATIRRSLYNMDVTVSTLTNAALDHLIGGLKSSSKQDQKLPSLIYLSDTKRGTDDCETAGPASPRIPSGLRILMSPDERYNSDTDIILSPHSGLDMVARTSTRTHPGRDGQTGSFCHLGQGKQIVQLPPLHVAFPPSHFPAPLTYSSQYLQQQYTNPTARNDHPTGTYGQRADNSPRQQQLSPHEHRDTRHSTQVSYPSYLSRRSPNLPEDPQTSRKLPPLNLSTTTACKEERWQTSTNPTHTSQLPTSNIHSPTARYPLAFPPYPYQQSYSYPPVPDPRAHPKHMYMGSALTSDSMASACVDPHISSPYARNPLTMVSVSYTSHPEASVTSEKPIKKKRKRANAAQLQALNDVYSRTAFPSTEERAELACKLDMTPRSVQIWFQNKRQSMRQTGRQPSFPFPDVSSVYSSGSGSINPSSIPNLSHVLWTSPDGSRSDLCNPISPPSYYRWSLDSNVDLRKWSARGY